MGPDVAARMYATVTKIAASTRKTIENFINFGDLSSDVFFTALPLPLPLTPAPGGPPHAFETVFVTVPVSKSETVITERHSVMFGQAEEGPSVAMVDSESVPA